MQLLGSEVVRGRASRRRTCDGEATTWREPVSDEQYTAAHHAADLPGQA